MSTPNPFAKLAPKISRPRVRTIDSLDRSLLRANKLRCALISFPSMDFNTYTAEGSGSSSPRTPDRQVLAPRRKNYRQDFIKEIRNAIEKAKPNVICTNEMSFPCYDFRPTQGACQELQELARTTKTLIIAGSSHDKQSMGNVGRIFFPGCDREGLSFFKQISAEHGAGERIRVPGDRCSLLLKAFGINIGVLICMDMGDFSAVQPLVAAANILFVPCYTASIEPLRHAGETVSRALPGIVALTNHHNAGVKSSLWIDRGNPARGQPKKSIGAGVKSTVHAVDVEELTAAKNATYSEAEEQVRWLFGYPIIQR